MQNLNLVEGWVTIDGNSSLETLEGLSLSENQQVHLTISSNPNLLNFNGLERINKLGYVIIRSNPKLVNFKGMDQVQEISGLEVSFNETQTSFEGLENVRLIGTLEIIGLNITNFNGFQGVESISSLTLYNLYDLEDFTGFTGTVTFSIDLMSNGIRKLEGLTVSEELSRVNIKDTSLGNLRELSNLKK